jgi:hypothetical protein
MRVQPAVMTRATVHRVRSVQGQSADDPSFWNALTTPNQGDAYLSSDKEPQSYQIALGPVENRKHHSHEHVSLAVFDPERTFIRYRHAPHAKVTVHLWVTPPSPLCEGQG